MAGIEVHENWRSRARPRSGWSVPALGVLCALLLAWGWSMRQEAYLNAEFGLGYGLGITGTVMMVLLLLYSVRKRARSLRSRGRISRWLDVHMWLGLLGPTAVLFHANFQIGSLNSTVALGCVLVVASSGVVGRLLYPKIHHRLTGRRADLRELKEVARSERAGLGRALATRPELAHELESLEALALAGGDGVLGATLRSARLRRRTRSLERDARMGAVLHAYTTALRRVAEFRAYERLFALWHAFHLPFCIMLFIAAVVHVIAVHMY